MRHWAMGTVLMFGVGALGVLCAPLVSSFVLIIALFAVVVVASIVISTETGKQMVGAAIVSALIAACVVFGEADTALKLIRDQDAEPVTVANFRGEPGLATLSDATIHTEWQHTLIREVTYRRSRRLISIVVVPITGAQWRRGDPITMWARGPIEGQPRVVTLASADDTDFMIRAVNDHADLDSQARMVELNATAHDLIIRRSIIPLAVPFFLFTLWSIALLARSRRNSSTAERLQKG